MQVQELEPLVGEWTTELRMPGGDEMVLGRTTFEWLEGGGYLIQRSVMENPRSPRGIIVIGPDGGGERVVAHYFDSRGVARIYEIGLAEGVLRLWRDDPRFAQRFSGRFGADGTTIDAAWERRHDGGDRQHDFDLTYAKVAPRRGVSGCCGSGSA